MQELTKVLKILLPDTEITIGEQIKGYPIDFSLEIRPSPYTDRLSGIYRIEKIVISDQLDKPLDAMMTSHPRRQNHTPHFRMLQ